MQYLIKVEGYDFVRAVQIVCADAPFLSSPPVIGEKNSGFALPPRGDNFKAYQYLAGRGICDEVLAFCFHTGRVYGTNRKTAEREYTNCVFVGFDESEIRPMRGCGNTGIFSRKCNRQRQTPSILHSGRKRRGKYACAV